MFALKVVKIGKTEKLNYEIASRLLACLWTLDCNRSVVQFCENNFSKYFRPTS